MSLKKGFTLVEMVVGIFLLSIGIFAVVGVIQKFYLITSLYLDRFVASYLAQEGIEIVRNIRDSNWLNNEGDWRRYLEGFNVRAGGADYNDYSLIQSLSDVFLKLGGDGYSYDSGSDTKFKRKIYINSCLQNPYNCLNVKVQVDWETRGKNYSVVIQENIYNWWNR